MACEGIAIANQSLLSQTFSERGEKIIQPVKYLVKRSCQLGIFSAGLLSCTIYVFWEKIISTFTTSSEIQQAAGRTLPIFLFAQSKLFA